VFQPSKASYDVSMLKRIEPEIQKPLQEQMIDPLFSDKQASEHRMNNSRQQKSIRGLKDLVTSDSQILGGGLRKPNPGYNFMNKSQQPTFELENDMNEGNRFDNRNQFQPQNSKNFKGEFSRMEVEQPNSSNTPGVFQYSQSSRPNSQSQRPFSQNTQRQIQAPQFTKKPYGGNGQNIQYPTSQNHPRMSNVNGKYNQGPQSFSQNQGQSNFPKQQFNPNRQTNNPYNTQRTFQGKRPNNQFNSFAPGNKPTQFAGSQGSGFNSQNQNRNNNFMQTQHQRSSSFNSRSQSRDNNSNFAMGTMNSYSQQQAYPKNDSVRNLLDIPLHNLNEDSQGMDDYKAFSSANMMQRNVGYPSSLKSFDKYPSYKSNSQNMNSKW